MADLRADAWGHGAAEVARTLLGAGFDSVVVDETTVAEGAIAGGIPGSYRYADETDLRLADGLTLFGLPGGAAAAKPVMTLSGRVLGVKLLKAGEGVSYGYHHRAASDTRVALVTGGYAQGVLRSLGSAISVGIGADRHRVVGRVAMDVCVVDIGEADVQRDAAAVFFGDPGAGAPALSEWTRLSGLRASEIVSVVGVRAERRHMA
ncbi:MAG: alanine racemase [Actinobacteria bacterium]|nr:alanine racemase [Actinomycetota bacterium]